MGSVQNAVQGKGGAEAPSRGALSAFYHRLFDARVRKAVPGKGGVEALTSVGVHARAFYHRHLNTKDRVLFTLLKALSSKDSQRREAAAYGLCGMKDPAVLPYVLPIACDTSLAEQVRAKAVEAIEEFAGVCPASPACETEGALSWAVPFLVTAFHSADSVNLKRRIAIALGSVGRGSEEAVSLLEGAVEKAADARLVEYAAASLGALRDESAVGALMDAALDKKRALPPETVVGLLDALEKIGVKEYKDSNVGAEILPLLAEESAAPEVREKAASVLGVLGTPRVLNTLRLLLGRVPPSSPLRDALAVSVNLIQTNYPKGEEPA